MRDGSPWPPHVRILLWFEYLLKCNPQCNRIKRYGLWEVIVMSATPLSMGFAPLLKGLRLKEAHSCLSAFCHVKTQKQGPILEAEDWTQQILVPVL